MDNVHGLNDPDRRQSNNNFYNRRRPAQQNRAVHGFNDINRNNNGDNRSSQFNVFQQVAMVDIIQTKKVLFVSGRTRVKPPGQQDYWDMLKYTCCPVIKPLSLTVILLIIYLGVFIAECIVGINEAGTLLQANNSTLVLMGANVPQLIRNGQVWRVITAAVLHANFIHFFGNFISTVIITSRVEHTLGSFRLLVLYIIAAIAANFFSALINFNSIKVGASTCLYAALGYCLGYLIINWTALGQISPILRCQIMCIVGFLIIFGLLFTSFDGGIDYMGHLGGFIVGVFGTSLGQRISEQRDCSKFTRIGFGFTLAFFVILIIILFFVIHNAT